jgi:hypothetical protein
VRRIACLHTAHSNVAVFDDAWRELRYAGSALHAVRPDLLAAVERSGGLSQEIIGDTQQALRALGEHADAVLLTCSTLGPCADAMVSGGVGRAIVRADGILAQTAVIRGRHVSVLCAVETTLDSTRSLFEQAACATGAIVTVHLVQGAWSAFRSGDSGGYLKAIACAADRALEAGASVVALAQCSMAGAVGLARTPAAVLASPGLALQAAMREWLP